MVGNLNTWRSHWCWCHSLKIDWEPCIRDLKCATSLQLGAPPVCNFDLMHFKWQVFLKFLLLYFFRHYCTVQSQWKEYLRVFWPHGRSLSWLWQVWRQDRSSQYAARCDFRDGIICWFGADQGREASASWHYCPTRGCLMERMEQLTWLSPARWPAPTLLVLKPKQVLLWQRHARGRWETLLMLANVRASSSSPLRWKRWVAFTLEPPRKPAVWEALPKSDARQCLDSLFPLSGWWYSLGRSWWCGIIHNANLSWLLCSITPVINISTHTFDCSTVVLTKLSQTKLFFRT